MVLMKFAHQSACHVDQILPRPVNAEFLAVMHKQYIEWSFSEFYTVIMNEK